MGAVLGFMRELAVTEERPDAITVSEGRLWEMLAGSPPLGECVMIEQSGKSFNDGRDTPPNHRIDDKPAWHVVGYVWFLMLPATFSGRTVLYIEDLVIGTAHRGGGLGEAAMALLAGLAQERGCSEMHWSVVQVNTRAMRFYERLGGQTQQEDGTVRYAMSADGLSRLVERINRRG